MKPSFWEWDGFDPVPEDVGGEILPEQVDLGAAGQREVDLTPPQKPLSRAYKHLKFGPDIRAVTVSTPYDTDLHVEALLKLRDGTAKTVDLTTRRFAVFCPESPGQRVAEMVLVASDTSTFRTMDQDKPVRVGASNLSCARYVGTASGVEHHHTQSANTTEKWTATGLVFQHYASGFQEESDFLYHLVGGTVEWSFSGTNGGCSYQATATLQIKPDGSMGSLNVHSWHIYRKELVRGTSPRMEPAGRQRNHHVPERHPDGHLPPAHVARVRRPVPRARRARERRARGHLDERRAFGWGLRRDLQLASGAGVMRSVLAKHGWAPATSAHRRRLPLGTRRKLRVPATHVARVPEGGEGEGERGRVRVVARDHVRPVEQE